MMQTLPGKQDGAYQKIQYDQAILLLGIYPEELKSGSLGGISSPIFIAALSTAAKT